MEPFGGREALFWFGFSRIMIYGSLGLIFLMLMHYATKDPGDK